MLPMARQDPCPERAIICNIPEIGYIPVLEFSPSKIVIQDPKDENLEHEFENQNDVIVWLNEYFKKRFNVKSDFNMKWNMLEGRNFIKGFIPINPDIFNFRYKKFDIKPKPRKTKMDILASLVLQNSEKMRRRVENFIILETAVFTIEAQKILKKQLKFETFELKRIKKDLDDKLQRILKGIREQNQEENGNALLETVKKTHAAIFSATKKDYGLLIRAKENKLITELIKGKRKRFKSRHSRGHTLQEKTDNLRKPLPLIPLKLHVNITDPKSVEAPNTSKTCSKLPSLQPATGPTPSHLNSNRSGVTDSLKTSDEERVIEISSDEEENPNKRLDRDFEIETISMNKNVNLILNVPSKKKKKIEMPKPIKKLPHPPPMPVFTDVSKTLNNVVSQENVSSSLHKSSSANVLSNISTSAACVSSCNGIGSAAILSKNTPMDGIKSVDSLPPRREFVSVDERPINSQILPMETSSRIDVFKASSYQLLKPDKGVRSLLKSTLPGASNLNQQRTIKCKNLTPIGKLDPQYKFCQIKGKPLLVSKSGKDVLISKLPLTTSSLINNKADSATVTSPNKVSLLSTDTMNSIDLYHTKPEIKQPIPIISNLGSKSSKNINLISSDKSNIVTLYHPSLEISESRIAQFVNLKSGQLPQVVSGPEIQPPLLSRPNFRPVLTSHVQPSLLLRCNPYRSEFSQRGKIRVLLPKRTQNKESQ